MTRIKSSLWKIATETPHTNGVYAYLYLDPRVEEMLQIIDGFNTFKELVDELILFDRSLWTLRYEYDKDSKFNVWSINGNGFLKKQND